MTDKHRKWIQHPHQAKNSRRARRWEHLTYAEREKKAFYQRLHYDLKMLGRI